MTDRWYAVPGYKGKSQHGEIRDPHVLDASGQLVCVCEGLDIAERIVEDHNTLRHWQGTPDGIVSFEPGSTTVLVDAPPLPDGSVYAGRLGDYPTGHKLEGWTWRPGVRGWRFDYEWHGMGGNYWDSGTWHYAKPTDTGDK